MSRSLKSAAKNLVPRWLCVWRLRPAAGNAVLLTFDDGPHPEATPAVLDRLRAYNARAIFFVVGKRIPCAPQLLARIVEEGHWLGNHTYNHPNDRRMAYREYRQDLRQCQQAIFDHSGVYPRFHRPPSGQMTIASLAAPKACGLFTMNWSCSSEDWRFRSNESAIHRGEEMGKEVSAGDIVLFHDEKMHTLAALDCLLPALQSRGFCLAPELKYLL